MNLLNCIYSTKYALSELYLENHCFLSFFHNSFSNVLVEVAFYSLDTICKLDLHRTIRRVPERFLTLRKKCPYSEFFLSVFIFPHLDQKNCKYQYILCSVNVSYTFNFHPAIREEITLPCYFFC